MEHQQFSLQKYIFNLYIPSKKDLRHSGCALNHNQHFPFVQASANFRNVIRAQASTGNLRAT